MPQLIPSFRVLAVVAALALAPTAHAGVPANVSRDTGVGLQIAAQGNAALAAIRAENQREIQAWHAALPAHLEPVSLPLTAPANGGGGGGLKLASQHCAK